MAELERIEITRVEHNQYRFYRVLGSEDRQSGRGILDTHFFVPGELLELAAYVEQNRAQLEQEAQEDEARDAHAWSADMADMQQIKQEGDIYIIGTRVDHYNVFRYQGEAWEQIAHFNEQEVRALVAPMQFIGESQGHREYYRPTGA
jgi:hypothetical protein